MQKKKATLCAFILTGALLGAFGADQAKKVECSIEIMPNYLWHLFAVSNIWDLKESRYAREYADTVPAADKAILFANRKSLTWGNGGVSKFTPLFFFVPLSREITPDRYWEYLDDAKRTMKDNRWDQFAERYCPAEKERIRALRYSDGDIAAFGEICAVMKANFAAYEGGAWQSQRETLLAEKAAIDSYFSQRDMIGDWERKLGIPYKGEGFYPVLTYANAIDPLPSANNLSASRNNFAVNAEHADGDIDLMIHEIGIFILYDLIMRLYQDPAYQTEKLQRTNAVYQAAESYVEFVKGEITGDRATWEGNMYNGASFNFKWFFDFYKAKADATDPETLLREAIAEFARQN